VANFLRGFLLPHAIAFYAGMARSPLPPMSSFFPSGRAVPGPTPRREVVKEAAIANREDFKNWLKDCVHARLRFAGMRR
jgi:hypothetical protein